MCPEATGEEGWETPPSSVCPILLHFLPTSVLLSGAGVTTMHAGQAPDTESHCPAV